MSEPVKRPGARHYVLTRAGNAEAIRAELDDVTLTLVALSTGERTWDQVYPELTNGDRQDVAIGMAWERMQELTRELKGAEGDE